MSSETLLQLMEEPPATILPPDGLEKFFSPAADAPSASSGSDVAAPDPSPEPSLQARRILAARDINRKIESLEKDIAGLSAAIADSQAQLQGSMTDLQNRSSNLMADMMRVSSRLEKDRQLQHDQHRVLDLRLTGSVTELGRELDETAAMLQAQKAGLARLQDSHDMLQRLHVHLDKVVSRQGQSLGILATDTHQQLQLIRSHIESLNQLYREQQEALLALSSDHELLALKSGQLEARVTGIGTVLTRSIGETRQRFRTVAAIIAVLAVVSLGLIAYFQLFPSAVPESVRLQLSGLSTGLSQQSSSSDALRQELAALQEKTAGLDARLTAQAAEIAGLRSQSRQTGRNLQELRRELSALKAELAELDAAATTEVDAMAVPPVAMPGTRPSL